jgi:hypothetical protein
LEGFALHSKSVGRLIYLTPRGVPPASVSHSDERVVSLSYTDLATLIADNVHRETEERGRVFATEFRRCIERLLKTRFEMTKPTLSDSTKLLLARAEQFRALREQAKEETAEFLEWMYTQAQRTLEPILGGDIVTQRMKDGILFRLPEWTIDKVQFGIAYRMRADPRRRLFIEQSTDPWVGVAVLLLDGSESDAACEPIAESIGSRIAAHWSHGKDLAKPHPSWPLWRYIAVTGDNLDAWATDVIGVLAELTSALLPSLSAAASAMHGSTPPTLPTES